MDGEGCGPGCDEGGRPLKGIGISYGAVTVVNAIPCGRGATLGIDLRTIAEFEPGGDTLNIRIDGAEPTDDILARACVEDMHDELGVPCHGVLTIKSEIPVSRGLKSSSSAANAICLAVRNAHGSDMDDLETIRVGCRSSIGAGVSITGAFDDACGCHLGGLVATDNLSMTVESRVLDVGDRMVLIHVPDQRKEKKDIDPGSFRRHATEFQDMMRTCIDQPFSTLIRNGRKVAEILGVDDSLVNRALDKGALAAGVTGTGPAIVIIADDDVSRNLLDTEGPFLTCRLRCSA